MGAVLISESTSNIKEECSMKKSLWLVFSAFAIMIIISSLSYAETYPDPIEAGPNIYHKIFENERVRVSEIRFNPGDTIPMHTHIFEHLVYMIESGTLELSYPDGTKKMMDGVSGQTMWIPAESHAAENIGTTPLRALIV